MKTSSGTGSVKRSIGVTCLLINQFPTPGLGSLMAKRYVAGAIQLTLAIVRFCLFVAWFVVYVMAGIRAVESEGPPAAFPMPVLLILGVNIFIISWLLAWFTSISVWRESRKNQPSEPPRELPPRI